ncbi:uncharacterized protein LOC142565825 [Dermacentor variabilis]|uniref:uncharacterized protein LOC142565825 n=1 Tax=Dermacentor variabilis TaxID=34621 RepID=UPI003F5BE536
MPAVFKGSFGAEATWRSDGTTGERCSVQRAATKAIPGSSCVSPLASPRKHDSRSSCLGYNNNAPSQLPEVTQTQATSGTRLYHCSAVEIASTSSFATAVSQHVGDNAYEIIGPDDECPQGANDISVAEVSQIPPGVTMTDDTAAIDT